MSTGAIVSSALTAPLATELSVTLRWDFCRSRSVSAQCQPQKIVNLGAKQMYFYPDMKVIFTNGKVSDVQ